MCRNSKGWWESIWNCVNMKWFFSIKNLTYGTLDIPQPILVPWTVPYVMITVDRGSTSTITVRPIVLATFLFEQAAASISCWRKKGKKRYFLFIFLVNQKWFSDSKINKDVIGYWYVFYDLFLTIFTKLIFSLN